MTTMMMIVHTTQGMSGIHVRMNVVLRIKGTLKAELVYYFSLLII
jgi:hypothetical protein